MVCRLNQTKQALVYLHSYLIYKREWLKVDQDLRIPRELSEVLGKTHLWHSIRQAQIFHNQISKALDVCKADTATMAIDLAALLFVRVQIKEGKWLNESDSSELYTIIVRNATRMFSSVHYLSFVCDLFYAKMQSTISSVFGEWFLQFEPTLFVEHCHHALRNLCQPHAKDKNIGEFMQFWVEPDSVITTLNDCQPGLLCGQGQHHYPHLANALCKVYSAPTSGASIERNHRKAKWFTGVNDLVSVTGRWRNNFPSPITPTSWSAIYRKCGASSSTTLWM